MFCRECQDKENKGLFGAMAVNLRRLKQASTDQKPVISRHDKKIKQVFLVISREKQKQKLFCKGHISSAATAIQ